MLPDYNKFWQSKIKEDNRAGKRYGWFRRRRYAVLAKLFPRYILKHFPARKYHLGVASIAEGVLCDIGCGLGGAVALYYALSGKPAIGLDISPEAIHFAISEKCRLGFNEINYLVSRISHTPLPDKYFDTVYLGQVLEHIPDEHRVLREATRIIKPNGLLIITVPKENLLPSPYHLREYTAGDVEKLLKPYGNGEIKFYSFDQRRIAVSVRVKGTSS